MGADMEDLDDNPQAADAEASTQHEMPVGAAEDPASQTLDESYIHVFLMKYVCPAESCGGTLAPLQGSTVSQCNMCVRLRSEQEFLGEMQQYC